MVEYKHKHKSRTLDYVILVLVLLAAAIFAYARIAGARVGMQDGIVTRRAIPSVMFMGERLNVELRLDANSLPRCELPPSSSDPVYAILVMDTSGSMIGLPLASAQAAATEFVDLLDMDVDRVGLIKFDDTARILSRGFDASREDVMRSIERLAAGNMTNMGDGLQLAYQMIQEAPIPPNAVRLLIVLSDGMPNVGPDPQPLAQKIRDETGFRVVAVALGQADQAYLSTLVTDPATDVLVSADPTGLLAAFGAIAQRYVNVLATDVRVRETYNNDAFSVVPFSVRTADASQTGLITWSWPFLGDRGRNAGYQLRPRRMGSHAVVTAPGDMSLVDCNGQPISQTLPVGPPVLVLFPWWVFIILGVIGLLWLLYRIIEEIRFGRVPYGPGVPTAPKSPLVPPVAHPSNQGSPTGDWHGKTDI